MMDSTVRARVDSDLKQEAEAIFKKLGLSTSQAIVMFLNNEGVKTIQIAIDVAKDLHGKLIDEVKIKK